MKTNKLAKILLVALSLMLLACALLATTVSAETVKPDIKNMNVRYSDKFELMYAVPADTVRGGSATLYLYDEDPAKGAEAIKEYTLTKTELPADSGLPYEAYIFYTQGVSAKALDKVFYVQVVDAEENASDVKSYSVVEYLYTKLADIIPEKPNTEVQKNFWKSVITFGTCAQQRFLSAEELKATTLISDYCYVTTEGCTVDGKTAAVLPQNKAFTIAGDNGALSDYTLTTYTSYDKTAGENISVIKSSSLTLSDVSRAHVTAGGSRVYKSNVETFEGDTIGGKPAAMGYDASHLIYNTYSAGTTTNVKEDTVFGKNSNVMSVNGMFQYIEFIPVLGCDAAEAKQFELSFDLKVDDTTIPDATKEEVAKRAADKQYQALKLNFRNASNNEVTNALRLDIFADGTLRLSRNSVNYVVPASIRTNEYNSYRIVVRTNAEGNSVIDVYINNFTDTPDASFVITGTYYTHDATTITKTYFTKNTDNYDYGSTFCFDNVWCGFVK